MTVTQLRDRLNQHIENGHGERSAVVPVCLAMPDGGCGLVLREVNFATLIQPDDEFWEGEIDEPSIIIEDADEGYAREVTK